MKGRKQLFSSAKTGGRDDWGTPLDFFAGVNKRFNFQLDAAASLDNSLCPYFLDEEVNALRFSHWTKHGAVWCNPPYSKCQKFLERIVDENIEWGGHPIVCLIPVRSSNPWWHDQIMNHATAIGFVKGRLKFQGAKYDAPFPSALVTFHREERLRRSRIKLDFSPIQLAPVEIYSLDRQGNII
jgi:phage N-6-adenine-methyltransferase